ncbi:MAG: preprotein translocase subunit SecE [Alphaproteobacteria bacterium]|nr:preprotein translocase subunit SecE [Alphaproteobacteria bacterium]
MKPNLFFKQVVQEVKKVTWPTRKETLLTSMMVFIMAASAAIFFLMIDQVFAFAAKQLLGLGG